MDAWFYQTLHRDITDIPEEILERIRIETTKEPLLNHNTIKNILRNLKLQKYYDCIYLIFAHIQNDLVPIVSPELENIMYNMLNDVRQCQLKQCLGILPYGYVLYKLFQHLKKDDYLQLVPLLKSEEKLSSYDRRWKAICEELQWEYIPSATKSI